MVGHKSNIDQEISHYPLQAHSESLLLTHIYSGDLRVYPLRIRTILILNDLECVGFRYWLRKPCVCVCVCTIGADVNILWGCLRGHHFLAKENGHQKPAFTKATYFGKTIITDALKNLHIPRTKKAKSTINVKDDFVTLV